MFICMIRQIPSSTMGHTWYKNRILEVNSSEMVSTDMKWIKYTTHPYEYYCHDPFSLWCTSHCQDILCSWVWTPGIYWFCKQYAKYISYLYMFKTFILKLYKCCLRASVDTEMCCPKGKFGCQYFILLTLKKKKIRGHKRSWIFLIKN